MCWNAEISLNTFLFSSAILILIIYNNTYTQYKVNFFNNIYAYLFLLSFIFMQLVEFFLWKNINNKKINHVLSVLGALLLFLQPAFSLMLISNGKLRNILLLIYVIPAITFFIYLFVTVYFYTTISQKNHLVWHWGPNNYGYILFAIWLFFLVFSFFYEKQYLYIGFGLVFLILAFVIYNNDGSAKSIWCWSINIIMFILAIELLVYLPLKEGKCFK